jgi:hypothetical protein
MTFFRKRQLGITLVPAFVLTVVSLLLTLPSANAAQLVWGGDFEEGASSINGSRTADFAKKVEQAGIEADVDVQSASGMGACTRPRAGSYAGRSRILSGGAGEQVRAEIKANAPGVLKFQWDGPEYWLAVSLCLADWPSGSDVGTVYQIHAPNELSGSRCDFAGNALTIGVSKDTVFKIKLSTKGAGYYTAWHNGTQVASGSGLVNVNWKDSCGNPIDKKYSNGPHIGFYGGANYAGPKTIYIDSVKVAEGTSGFDLVSAGAAAASAVPNAPSNLVVQ